MNRLDRIHVVNVFMKDNEYYIRLSDATVLSWSEWINGGREDLVK